MILLTGATGTTGRETVAQLRSLGAEFRVMSRDVARAARLLGDDLSYVAGDFAEPESLPVAFRGVDTLSLLCAPVPELAALELKAVAAAERAGIRRIVKMSAIRAAADAPTAIRRWHGAVEQRIAATGLGYTHLWPNAFMQNFARFAPFIRDGGVFYAPLGDARVSLVDVVDVAAVTVAALTESGHEGRTYEITGPEALSYGDCAAVLTDLLGMPVRYESVPDVEAHAALVDAGIPVVLADALIEIDGLFRDGFGAPVTDVVARVCGRPARSFAEFARANAGLFQ